MKHEATVGVGVGVGGGSVANTNTNTISYSISENNSCMIRLLLVEVLISNICNIADCCIYNDTVV